MFWLQSARLKRFPPVHSVPHPSIRLLLIWFSAIHETEVVLHSQLFSRRTSCSHPPLTEEAVGKLLDMSLILQHCRPQNKISQIWKSQTWQILYYIFFSPQNLILKRISASSALQAENVSLERLCCTVARPLLGEGQLVGNAENKNTEWD